jgi:hypothetical protein
MNPTEEQALQFAVMISAGLPASEAILYFIESEDPAELAMLLKRWTRSKAVKRALSSLHRKPWQDMTLDERMRAALEQHYNGLAYMLFSNNYLEANSTDKGKLDTARAAIESKLAGTAGKLDALSQFYDDVNSGKLKLKSAGLVLNGPAN